MEDPEALLAEDDGPERKRAEAEQQLEATKESIRPETQLPGPPPPQEIGHGGQTVGYLLARHTFMDYFAHIASRRYQHSTPEGRMNKMITDHKWWYRLCFGLDICVKSVVIGGLVTAAVFVFVKAIA
ncbi:hypothetical protein [Pseudoclavibacter sp. 8L]|uniref:hypothetical protein n=1 Tax=Pseudoclavibacter sp. 8L TaxID=2653162 RepID=UPI0012EFD91F|nr:hypothetical protein [Pseudoclavibacter sp. 8L]VXB29016.1 hypothetical protein PSCLAVI8L_130388 [Pseudoclavibacter sp. 8L]